MNTRTATHTLTALGAAAAHRNPHRLRPISDRPAHRDHRDLHRMHRRTHPNRHLNDPRRRG